MLISSPFCAPIQSMAPAEGASVAGASVAGISVAGASVAGASVAGASVAGGWVAAGVCAAPPQAANNKLVTANTVIILVILYISSFSIRFLNMIVTKGLILVSRNHLLSRVMIGFCEKEWVRCSPPSPLLSCPAT